MRVRGFAGDEVVWGDRDVVLFWEAQTDDEEPITVDLAGGTTRFLGGGYTLTWEMEAPMRRVSKDDFVRLVTGLCKALSGRLQMMPIEVRSDGKEFILHAAARHEVPVDELSRMVAILRRMKDADET